MVTGWIDALAQQDAETRNGAAGGDCQRRATDGPAFTLIELLVVIATIVLLAGIPPWAEGSAEPDSLGQALAALRECVAKSPAPWPQAWREEYEETIRQIAIAHRDSPGYAARLEILRNGFAPYWEAVPKNDQRSLFEVRQAEVRWYVESLMAGELPTENSREKLREQYKSLVEYATEALLTQFPFLDPNVVQTAKADHLNECYRNIEAPLLPIFQRPFSGQQAGQLKERWHSLRYARVDLWRQLGGGRKESGVTRDTPSGKMHPDYLLSSECYGFTARL
jgi:hypothetical protein